MAVDKDALDAIARTYVWSMTSIRSRRVQRLVAREFARFDDVFPVTVEDGTPALLALGEDAGAALIRTDGRGAAASIARWTRLRGVVVTTSFDLAKDSLPILSWTIWHPSFAPVAGALTISAADLSPGERSHAANVLRVWGGSAPRRGG
jgi:hypothetical protein